MAALARDQRTEERIDAFLAYCMREWEAILEVADEWADWSDLERLEFRTEWPIRTDRLEQLRQYAKQGLLSPAQRVRFDGLLRLEARHRRRLEGLLADSGGPDGRSSAGREGAM